MSLSLSTKPDILNILRPETELELRLLGQPEIQTGLDWGVPRYGHPEGKVVFHVREIYENINKLDIEEGLRSELRLVALLHDSFKYMEHKGNPRDWTRHHAVIARNFAQNFISSELVLDLIELHDEAYYCWRMIHVTKDEDQGLERLNRLLNRIKLYVQEFYLFFKCDTCTGDKIAAPLLWWENNIKEIQIVNL